jgi:hypothetical protein
MPLLKIVFIDSSQKTTKKNKNKFCGSLRFFITSEKEQKGRILFGR